MFEAYRPTESLSEDGSIIIDYIPNDGDDVDFLPTETITAGEDRGLVVNWFPTETFRPMESLGDGGIIIDFRPGSDKGDGWLAEDHVDPSDPSIGFFPAETVRPMESLDDGGIIIIGGFPTETIRPTESLDDGGIIIGGFPTAGEDRSLVIDWFV
jgi:hypothetical protein